MKELYGPPVKHCQVVEGYLANLSLSLETDIWNSILRSQIETPLQDQEILTGSQYTQRWYDVLRKDFQTVPVEAIFHDKFTITRRLRNFDTNTLTRPIGKCHCYLFLQDFSLVSYNLYFIITSPVSWASIVAQTVKYLPAIQETWVWSLGWEDPLEKEMATHLSILAWRIPWTEEPGGLQSMGLQRAGHDWATNTHTPESWISLKITTFISLSQPK